MLQKLQIIAIVVLGLIAAAAGVEVAWTAHHFREQAYFDHPSIVRYVATSADGSVVYLGSGLGLLRSRDGGVKWEQILPQQPPAPPAPEPVASATGPATGSGSTPRRSLPVSEPENTEPRTAQHGPPATPK